MANKLSANAIQGTARLAGGLYLLLLPFGIFGILYAFSLVVSGDAAATAENIASSKSMYRFSILAALITQVVNIFVVLALYKVLKPVNGYMASLMKIFILLGAPIAMLSELNRFAALILVGGEEYLNVFSSEQLQTQLMFFLKLHEHGVGIASIFWGLWLFPMGYLIYQSGFLPRVLGILLVIGGFGYLVDFLIPFFFTNASITISQFTFIGEILLPLWLLIRGVNVEVWHKRQPEAA